MLSKTNKELFIIADIGSNHRNNLECAFRQIESAKEAGCHAAKFQMYTHKELYGYDGKLDFELPREWVPKLKEQCDKVGIEFMCSAFSPEGFQFLDPFVKMHKVASSESNDKSIQLELEKLGKPYLISHTDSALGNAIPMLCVVSYPAEPEDYDLSEDNCKAYRALSDHTLSDLLGAMAVAKGFHIFEKHFDGLGGSETPDYSVSISEYGMEDYCYILKLAHKIITAKEHPRPCEKEFIEKHLRRETPYGFYRLK